jgi:cytochrome c-type biogenesis protein CcmE
MTRKRRRLLVVVLGLGMLGVASALVLFALNSKGALAFFATPSDIISKGVPEGRRIRLGGLVEPGSVAHEADGRTIEFRITDGNAAVPVSYSGVVPDLFREGQGVVVEGALQRTGVLRADTLLAKHDERYMPPEVAEALKRSGHWQGEHPPAATAAKP